MITPEEACIYMIAGFCSIGVTILFLIWDDYRSNKKKIKELEKQIEDKR